VEEKDEGKGAHEAKVGDMEVTGLGEGECNEEARDDRGIIEEEDEDDEEEG
jgi:hypothetical protein